MTGTPRFILITSFVLAGCTDAAQPSSPGIPEIGVARVVIDDAAQRTIVRGLDVAGAEVARLDLIHGTFNVTDLFRDDFGDQTIVNGRKLDVTLHGEPHLTFEVAGFEPLLHMPAHPASERELAIFLDAPTVKPVLDRWQLGWDGAPADGEEEYVSGSIAGTKPFGCSSPATNCGTTSHGTMNTCGGGAAASSATRINASGSSYGTEYKIAQCCPSGSGGQSSTWFATKACSTESQPTLCDFPGGGPDDGVMTSCGCQNATVGCKSCAGYPASYNLGCSTSSTNSAINYCYVNELDSCSSDADCCNWHCMNNQCMDCHWNGSQWICV